MMNNNKYTHSLITRDYTYNKEKKPQQKKRLKHWSTAKPNYSIKTEMYNEMKCHRNDIV